MRNPQSHRRQCQALIGDHDKAFEWLDKAYEAREGSNITLANYDPYLKNLHGDPRLSAYLKRLGLPE